MTTPDTLASLIAKWRDIAARAALAGPTINRQFIEAHRQCADELEAGFVYVVSHEETRRQLDSKAVDVLLADNRILKLAEELRLAQQHIIKLEAALDALADKDKALADKLEKITCLSRHQQKQVSEVVAELRGRGASE